MGTDMIETPADPQHDSDAAGGRRVLVLSTDLGGGHDALAAGVRAQLVQLDSDIEVTIAV